MEKKLKVRVGFIALSGILMTAIFLFSSQTSGASNQLSKGLLSVLLERLHLGLTAEQIEVYNFVLRKIVHFSLYFLLAVCLSGIFLTIPIKPYQRVLLILSICVLYASGDEFHQFLSGTRNGNPLDVLVDAFGSICGCIIVMTMHHIWVKRKRENKKLV